MKLTTRDYLPPKDDSPTIAQKILGKRIDMKAAFEEWFRRERRGFEESMLARFEGAYVNTITEAAWAAWAGACLFLADEGAFTVEVNAQVNANE